jgi:hypothetical protein
MRADQAWAFEADRERRTEHGRRQHKIISP